MNHIIYKTSPYLLPTSYSGSSIILLAYYWVKYLFFSSEFWTNRRYMYMGLINQNNGTNNEFTKNMTVSSSITPKSCWKIFPIRKSSTISVIKAVVKKRPKQYFKQNENWYLCVLECLYMSVNLWNNVDITILFSKTTKNIIPKTSNNALIC